MKKLNIRDAFFEDIPALGKVFRLGKNTQITHLKGFKDHYNLYINSKSLNVDIYSLQELENILNTLYSDISLEIEKQEHEIKEINFL